MKGENLNKNLYVPEKAEIVDVRQMTSLEKYFKIRLLERETLGHNPGQFVMVTVFGVGEAPISVSSLPDKKSNEFELVVRNVGNVTQALHNLKTGAMIGIRGPYGTYFSGERFKNRDLLFIAGGIGLVPLRSFIKKALSEHKEYRNIKILYGAKTPSEILFKDELEEWSKLDNVDVLITVDKAEDGWQGNVGLITTLIPPLDIDSENTLVTIVGPPVMYKFVILSLGGKKIPFKNIYVSLERRMKCGIGKCGNCQIQGIYVCQDGPVFCYDDIKHLKEAI